NPSERALRSYGDTASAMGKDLNQLIEAVADATTGEFERLKEFGIKARSEGDNVSFTFKGVTTTIGKNAAEIEEYLTKLGEVNFAGAMSERMDTLNGAMSNFMDQVDNLFRSFGDGALGDAMKASLLVGADALQNIATLAKDANAAYQDFFDVIVAGATLSKEELSLFNEERRKLGLSKEEIEKEKEKNNLIQRRIDGQKTLAKIETEAANSKLSLDEQKRKLGLQILNIEKNLSEWRFKNLDAEERKLKTLNKQYQLLGQKLFKIDEKANAEASKERLKNLQAEAALQDLIKEKSIEKLISERDFQTAILTLDAERLALKEKFISNDFTTQEVRQYKELESQIQRVKDEENSYLQQREDAATEYKKNEQDKLKLLKREQDAKNKARKKEYDSVKKSLLTEEELIEVSYKKRLDIILQNTEEGTLEQIDLIEKLEKDKTEKITSLTERRNSELDKMNDRLKSVHESVYDDLGDTLLQYTKTGELSFKSMTDSIINQIQRMAIEMSIIEPLKNSISGGSGGGGLIGAIGSIAGSFFGGSAVTAGPQNSPLYNPGGTGSNWVDNFSYGVGKYHTGGIAGLKPDEVPAVLQRGEEVLTREDPRHRYNKSGGGSSRTIVNVINQGNNQVETQSRQEGNENIIDIIIKQTEGAIANNINNGRGLAPVLERKYNMSPTLGR
ncbi:MAG: hypothetical protein NE330_05815, partial [Lentisphaeraceae bacterium]|nr:hypothetical protein [Lentisphaeraceae bacterium]